MTVVSSPSSLCVAVAPYTRPEFYAPYHTLRRRASACEAASGGGVSACSRRDPPLNSVASVWSTKDRPAAPLRSSSSSRPGLDVANSLRGGCATGRVDVRRRRRATRPLRRFFAPALVWIIALVCDYDLWWRRGPWEAASAASSREINAGLLRFAWGRVAGSAVAYRRHFVCFHLLLGLALLSHIAVTVANPGFFQQGTQVRDRALSPERWCDRCERYKPPRAHHCGRCGACVARMDHHCILVANCVGAGNHKQLLLLVIYAAACAVHAIFLYSRLSRRLPPVLAPMGVVFCWLCSLLTQQLYGIGVDAGTVDRLQAAISKHRAAERVEVGVPMAPLPMGSAPPRFPDKNRGLGLGALRLDATASASWKERTEFADRPGASTATRAKYFPAADLRSGPFSRAAVDGDWGHGAIVRGASFCRVLWGSLREEILGEGPWVLWLVPTPPRLSPEAEARVYARQS